MPVGQAEEIIALALVFVVHVIGAAMLVWALIDEEQRGRWRNPPHPPGRGDGGGDDPPPTPPSPRGGGTRAPRPLPLTGGTPGRVRLREPALLGSDYERPRRRPGHPVTPTPRPATAPVPERRRRG